MLAAVVVVITPMIGSAARELELRLGGRRPVTWLGFRHLVNTGTTGHRDGIKVISWPKATSTNIHTWEWLTSVTTATTYLRFDAQICLGRPLGQCRFRLTSAHERGKIKLKDRWIQCSAQVQLHTERKGDSISLFEISPGIGWRADYMQPLLGRSWWRCPLILEIWW